MFIRRVILSLSLVLIVCNAGSIRAAEYPVTAPEKKNSVVIPSMNYVGPDDKAVWKGEIEGRLVDYFRLRQEGGVNDVLVVTSDDLPDSFKRIEYLDKGGDGSLDLVRMRIYEKTKGWRDVGITKENKYGLRYADGKFKEFLGKINGSPDVKEK